MDKANIYINDKEYSVEIAISEEDKEIGLQNRSKLAEDAGMLFVYDSPQTVQYWMKDTLIPLDIIFIDEYWEVIDMIEGEPNSEDILECDGVKYVLELNAKSGVKRGDEIDLTELEPDQDIEYEDEDTDVGMLVIGPHGKPQVELKGGERIFSRKNTKTLVRLAKKGYRSKQENDYKTLGRKIFQYIKIQDTNEPEYVEIKDK